MNAQEKEEYLREYEVLKKKGKPFFPYAVAKDSAMFLVVVVVIAIMSIVLGAEQGPKADPTTTTYTPRPEWYFFFLFELLRVIKPAELTPLATIGIPTLCLVLLLLLPFYDRNKERDPRKRPVATTLGVMTIVAMALLTFLGAEAGPPTEIEMDVAPQYEDGKVAVAGQGCLTCHKIGENGGTLGPDLTEIGSKLPAAGIRRTLINPSGNHASLHGAASRKARRHRRVLSVAPLTGTAAKPSRTSDEFSSQVRGMFDRIAGVYDLINSIMTVGLHHAWRERAADRAELEPGDSALDLCCGTGDLALALRDRVGPGGRVVGADFSERMLELASDKAIERDARDVTFEWADALELPYSDASFDAVTVGFGVRNLADLEAGFREMRRVLKPGGRCVILEITQPQKPPLSTFFALWFDRIVPLIGRVAGDPEAYSYLPESVRGFPPPEGLARIMDEAGLGGIRYTVLAGGIIAIHSGTRPA